MSMNFVYCPSCGTWSKFQPMVILEMEIGYGPKLRPYQEQQGVYEPEAIGQPVEEDYCSDCLYWMNIYNNRFSHRSIRIDGTHYWLYDMKTDGSGFLPYGGRQFEIRRKGFWHTEIVMMWYNAEIPEALREDLYDNAEWVIHENR